MRPSNRIADFIKEKEGFRANAYPDGNVYSIGYGNTYYADGRPVKAGDKITRAQGDALFKTVLERDFGNGVNKLVTSKINQNQFDALVSFAYNLGLGNLQNSTLLKRVNANPNDPAIRDEFKRWIYAGGMILPGLVTRRREEANIYFSSDMPMVLPQTETWAGIGLMIILIFMIFTNGKKKG